MKQKWAYKNSSASQSCKTLYGRNCTSYNSSPAIILCWQNTISIAQSQKWLVTIHQHKSGISPSTCFIHYSQKPTQLNSTTKTTCKGTSSWFPGTKGSQWLGLSPYSRRQIPFIWNSTWSTNVGKRWSNKKNNRKTEKVIQNSILVTIY